MLVSCSPSSSASSRLARRLRALHVTRILGVRPRITVSHCTHRFAPRCRLRCSVSRSLCLCFVRTSSRVVVVILDVFASRSSYSCFAHQLVLGVHPRFTFPATYCHLASRRRPRCSRVSTLVFVPYMLTRVHGVRPRYMHIHYVRCVRVVVVVFDVVASRS